ncbi:Mss4-like protein [Neohortaea acidophila]|uniref:Mss4-like protein n=1 Tax=Neohortaea acidophila TaxID=245834 RepID=A0A6A6PQL0_9PEZI|nr:Mss4-like protein [Neohortaea acidophila]KAF2482349.1 Mss4-like protein [Neohortaea acidophila]
MCPEQSTLNESQSSSKVTSSEAMADSTSAEKPPQSGEEVSPQAATAGEGPGAGSKRPFTGGCHCKRITYEVQFDPAELKNVSRCNCTFCQRLGLINLGVKNPGSDFKLVSPATREEIDDYAPRTKATEAGNLDVHRRFCSRCGVHVWSEGWHQFGDQRHDFFGVNLVTLDQPQDGLELNEAKFTYWDGLHNNWDAGKQDHPFPGGLL